MLEDKGGNIWFGTLGGGACRYDGRSLACTLFSRLAKLSEWLARCDAYEASVFSFNTQPSTSATRTSNGKHASW